MQAGSQKATGFLKPTAMKKTTLLFILALCRTGLAQNLQVMHESNPVNNGDTLVVMDNIGMSELVAYLGAKNTGSSAITIKAKRTDLSVIAGTTNSFCFGGQCYLPSLSVSLAEITLNAGEETAGADELSGHYYPDVYFGSSYIRYVFFDKNNVNDSAFVVVNYIAIDPLGIKENKTNPVKLFPNPSKNSLFVNSHKPLQSIAIYDVLGSLHTQIQVSGANNSGIDVSAWPEGIYLVQIKTWDAIWTERVVVNH